MTSLLLHPVGLDRSTWDAVDVASSIAIDLPGHGTARWTGAKSLEDIADAVAEHLEGEAGPLDLVGVSLGGMVALHLALRHTSSVRSILVACAPSSTPRDILLARADLTEELGMAGTLDVTIERWFTAEQVAQRGAGVLATEASLLRDDPSVIAQYWRMMAAHDVRDRLPDISVPTTALAANGDRSTPFEQLRVIAHAVPRGRYVELDGPHMIHLSDPVRFAAAVNEHLRWVDGLESG